MCLCGRGIFSSTDQVMFQFLLLTHQPTDQPASPVLNPFRALPCSLGFRVESWLCYPSFSLLGELQNGAVGVLRPEIPCVCTEVLCRGFLDAVGFFVVSLCFSPSFQIRRKLL